MTTAELIAELQKLPQNAKVVVFDTERVYELTTVTVQVPGRWEIEGGEPVDAGTGEEVVVLA